MFDLIPFTIFITITLFHIYMGIGAPLNYDYVLPTIKQKPLPFHSTMAIPVAILLTLSTAAFGYESGILTNELLSNYSRQWLVLTASALVFRGCFGLIVFHLLNKVIDPTLFKVWDLRLYSPLTLYLGISSFKVLGII